MGCRHHNACSTSLIMAADQTRTCPARSRAQERRCCSWQQRIAARASSSSFWSMAQMSMAPFPNGHRWKALSKDGIQSGLPTVEVQHEGCGGQGCFCVARATANEKVRRLLLNAGARDAKYALSKVMSLNLETAAQAELPTRILDGLFIRLIRHCARHGWSDAKLKEVHEQLFRSFSAHPH